MQKLVDAFKAATTEANRVKIEKHIRKHSMSVCLLSPDDCAFLRANGVNA